MKVQNLRKPTVLAVDDNDHNLVALEAVLGSDYKIITATSGSEALTAVHSRANEIDVILMDVQMPGQDGFETASEIKRVPAAADIPIIFITAIYKEDPFIKQGYAMGGVDYFSKPFDPEILKMKVGIYASVRHRTELINQREKQVAEAEKLLEVGRKLSSVLESLSVGILIADVNGRICQTNEQLSKICGYQASVHPDALLDMLGWWDKNRDLKTDDNPLSIAIRKGQTSHNTTIQVRCENQVSKIVLCSASPLLGLDQRVVGAVVALHDVTESRRIEADLEARIARVASINAIN